MLNAIRKAFFSHGRYIDVVIERDSSGGFHALAYIDEDPIEINGGTYAAHPAVIRAKIDEALREDEPSRA